MGRPPKVQPPRRPNPITNLKPIRKPTQIVGNIARKAMTGAAKRRLCPNATCNSPKIEDGVCVSCGTIIDDSNIVAEVQFGENSSGAAVVQGSFVSADQGTARTMGPAFRRAGGQEDREKSLKDGKREMQGLAGQFGIHENIVAQGVQIFKLASMQNFIQGRRMRMVAACCLYTAARQNEKCTVMLIDFAEACKVNIFKLGHCFKALHKTCTLQKILPVLPEDLIYRFASKLEFGDETERVALTAIRLAKRMAVDWMVMGRRPSGVCGACLIMAARMHNFRRTVKEVVYIVKVTTHTIQKRLDEFKYTASSDLTVEEFLGNQFLESAHDPPSFYEKSEEFQAQVRSRKRKRPLELEEDEADGEAGEDGQRQVQTLETVPEPNTALIELATRLEQVPAPTFRRDAEGFLVPPPPPAKELPIDPALLENTDDPRSLDALAAEHGDIIEEADAEAAVEVITPTKRGRGRPPKPGSIRIRSLAPTIDINEEWLADEEALQKEVTDGINSPHTYEQAMRITEAISDPHSAEHDQAFELADQRARLHIMMAHAKNPQKDVPMTENIEEGEFSGDPEIENCILTEREAADKEKIWVNANKDWLRDQQQKIFREKIAALGPPKATRKRKKKPRIGEGQTSIASSPAEAAEEVARNRFWSKKINYGAIRELFADSPAASVMTSRVTSQAGSTVAPSDAGTSVVGGSDAASSVAQSDAGNVLLDDLDDEDFEGPDLDDDWKKDYERDDDYY